MASHREEIFAVSRALDEYRLSGSSPREHAASLTQTLVQAWDDIYMNWTAVELGFDETPEEREKYDAFVALGKAILDYAELLLEGDL